MKILIVVFLSVFLAPVSCAQAKAAPNQRGNAERLGMTCAQILALSSTDWVAKFTAAKDAAPASTVLAIEEYGKCYDARTNTLAASLGKQGTGPLMGVRGNFRDFESALENFTAQALAVTQQSGNSVRAAYASLYEKQFRYAFYESYAQKVVNHSSPEANKPGAGSNNGSHGNGQYSEKPEADPMTLAKNHFGELLAALPEDKRHEIHAAFGQIFERSPIGEQWKIETYRYAIFVLEPSTSKTFSPPPF